MDLGRPVLPGLLGLGRHISDGHLEGVVVPLLGAEGAELAVQDADIGVVDVAVEDIGCHVPVLPLPDDVSHVADAVQIARGRKNEPLLPGEALSGLNLPEDGKEGRIEQALVHGSNL